MTMWLDDTDIESAEYDDSESSELYDGSEAYDEASRSTAAQRRRARQRRVALARRRQAQAQARSTAGSRTPTASARTPAQRETVAAIRNLDLETKLHEDGFRNAISAQNKRMNRSEYAAVLGVATGQFIESFNAPANPFAKAALRFAPLLLLSPQRQGTGFEAFIKDPRVLGAAAVAGITVVGENKNRVANASAISITAATEIPAGQQDQFIADVLDRGGKRLADKAVRWESSNAEIASIDATGRITAKSEGAVVITADADGIVQRFRLKVTPAVPENPSVNPPSGSLSASTQGGKK